MNDFIKLHQGGKLMLLRRSLIHAAYKLDYSDGSACTTVEYSNAVRWIVDETPEQIWEILNPRINRQEYTVPDIAPYIQHRDAIPCVGDCTCPPNSACLNAYCPRAPKVTC